jgi:hypothetical protein
MVFQDQAPNPERNSDIQRHYPHYWKLSGLKATIFYILIIITSIVGRQLMNNQSALKIGSYSIGSSLVFFIVTNFLVWMISGMCSLDLSGLIACFMMAIPFFQNQFMGDLVYTAFLFGSMVLLQRQNLVLCQVSVER